MAKFQIFLSSEGKSQTVPELLAEIEDGANTAAKNAAEAGEDAARAALDFTKQALFAVVDHLVVAEKMPKTKGGGSKAAAKKNA